MKGLVLVADDLTGALDAAARFTGACGKVPVHLDAASVPPSGPNRAFVVPTRDAGAGEALAMTRAALPLLHGAETAFRKIDSLLRGHWAIEIAATLQGGGFDRAVLAPAFPALGRTVRDGFVHVASRDGIMRRIGVDMVAALGAAGVDAARAATPEAMVPGVRALVCDAADEAAMLAIAAAGRALPGRTLWCGSAGLAGALAGRAPAVAAQRRAPLLMIVGSTHPVMLAQLAALRSGAQMPEIRVGGDVPAAAAAIAAALAQRGRALVLFDLAQGIDPAAAAARIDAAIGRLVPALAAPATLIASGGETLLSIMRAAGADSLTVRGEALPGIPVSTIEGGAWRGVALASKSGAFGAPETLLRLLGGAAS